MTEVIEQQLDQILTHIKIAGEAAEQFRSNFN